MVKPGIFRPAYKKKTSQSRKQRAIENCKLYLIGLHRVRELRRSVDALRHATDVASGHQSCVNSKLKKFLNKSRRLGIDVDASSPAKKVRKSKAIRKIFKIGPSGVSAKQKKSERSKPVVRKPGKFVRTESIGSGFVRVSDGAELSEQEAIKMCPDVTSEASGVFGHKSSKLDRPEKKEKKKKVRKSD